MITQGAKYVTDILIEEKIVSQEEKEIYQYGLELLISTVLNLFLVIVIGGVVHSVMQGLLYFLVLATLRTQAGGYHAPSYFTCGLLYCVMFVTVLTSSEIMWQIKISSVTLALILLINTYFIGKHAPVLHKKKMNAMEKKRAREKAVIRSFSWLAITIVLYHVDLKWAYTVGSSVTVISIFMMIGKRMEEKGNAEKN